VLALMTMNNSMNGKAFEVFIEKFLVPELWVGAVVVMDNRPAHKMAAIAPIINQLVQVLLTYHRILQILIPLNYGGHNLSLFCVTFLQLRQK
jgi:hypothetical protein